MSLAWVKKVVLAQQHYKHWPLTLMTAILTTLDVSYNTRTIPLELEYST